MKFAADKSEAKTDFLYIIFHCSLISTAIWEVVKLLFSFFPPYGISLPLDCKRNIFVFSDLKLSSLGNRETLRFYVSL